jgi:hypothetical protein
MYHPDLEEYRKIKEQGKLVPVYREIAADGETPVSVLVKIKRGDYAFLLESAEGSQGTAGYSFIGTEPYRVLSTRESDRVNPLSHLATELAKQRLATVEGLPDFYGGAVGYLGYETIRRLETLPSPESDPLALPESLFMFVDTVLIFDHALKQGVSPQICLDVAKKLREKVDIPLVFMIYYNPVFHYRLEKFCNACVGAGIVGLIISNLPPGRRRPGNNHRKTGP